MNRAPPAVLPQHEAVVAHGGHSTLGGLSSGPAQSMKTALQGLVGLEKLERMLTLVLFTTRCCAVGHFGREISSMNAELFRIGLFILISTPTPTPEVRRYSSLNIAKPQSEFCRSIRRISHKPTSHR